jgi:TonB family protein
VTATLRLWVVAAVLLAFGFGQTAPASADIRSFNTAAKAGDYKTAAAVAAETWPGLDKAQPDIAIIAREFAWAAMQAGDPKTAQVYSGFLVYTPPATAPPEYVHVVGRVLHAWAAFTAAPTRETRYALSSVLAERAAIHASDLISVRAAQALFQDDWIRGRWKEAAASGLTGVLLLRDYGKTLMDAGFQFEMGATAATFADRPRADAANQMRALSERVLAEALAASDPAMKGRLTHIYFNTNAWAHVAERMMMQEDRRFQPTPKSDTARRAQKLLTPTPGDPALPECAITREASTRTPRYPSGPQFSGWSGFATYRLTVAADGRFSEIRLMGAAPHSDFGAAVDRVIEDWRWTYRDSVRPPQCRMPEYYYVEFEFRLGD